MKSGVSTQLYIDLLIKFTVEYDEKYLFEFFDDMDEIQIIPQVEDSRVEALRVEDSPSRLFASYDNKSSTRIGLLSVCIFLQ